MPDARIPAGSLALWSQPPRRMGSRIGCLSYGGSGGAAREGKTSVPGTIVLKYARSLKWGHRCAAQQGGQPFGDGGMGEDPAAYGGIGHAGHHGDLDRAMSSLASAPNAVKPRISSLSAAMSILRNPRGSDWRAPRAGPGDGWEEDVGMGTSVLGDWARVQRIEMEDRGPVPAKPVTN
jgi:hypothetical protein